MELELIALEVELELIVREVADARAPCQLIVVQRAAVRIASAITAFRRGQATVLVAADLVAEVAAITLAPAAQEAAIAWVAADIAAAVVGD